MKNQASMRPIRFWAFPFIFLLFAGSLLADSPNHTSHDAGAVPLVDPSTGKIEGEVVRAPDSGTELDQIRIRQGDILTEVNEISVDRPESGREAFQEMRKDSKAKARVQRAAPQDQE